MNTFWQDIRYGLRTLGKNAGVTALAILALTLGIGANTAIFSVVNTVLLRPLPFPAPDELVWFWESQPDLTQAPFSAADFLDYQSQNRSFAQMSALRNMSFNLTGQGPAERVPGMVASANALALLGVHPILGRDFMAEDGAPGAPRVALLTYGFWQSHYGGDRTVTGRRISLNDEPVTVIGVLPASFRYGGNDIQLWANPHEVVPEVFPNSIREVRTNREMHYLNVIGRLKPGVSLAQAQADISAIVEQLHQHYPVTTGHAVQLVLLRELSAGPVRQTLLVLLAIVGLVLLIACANVANLLLARAAARQREIAIRTALGAGRLRIIRQLLTESTLLAFASGALGFALAWALVRLIVSASADVLPRVSEIGIDGRVLFFTLGVSLLTGIIFGLAPALAATRTNLIETLKEGARGSTAGLSHNRLRGFLVVSEVALSVMLLVGAGLLGRSLVRLLDVKPGFNPNHMVTMWMNFTGANYSANGKSAAFLDRLLPRVAALPGVLGVATSNDLPLEGDDTTTGVGSAEGRAAFPRGQEILVGIHSVSPGYSRAMGIPLLRGREISPSDNAASVPVVVINQKLADALWPGKDPLGKHFDLMGDRPPEVVGVVGNVLHNGLGEPPALETYVPFSQNPWTYVGLAIRSDRDPAALYSAVRGIVAELDSDLPVHGMRSMDRVAADTMTTRRLTLWLVGAFAALALILTVVGIYGVVSYSVTERTHEIGVRMALGAQRSHVLRLIVAQGMRLAVAGLAVGAAGAFFATRAMSSLLFGIRQSDPLTYVGTTALLALVALAACYLPARRGTALDPIVALRDE